MNILVLLQPRAIVPLLNEAMYILLEGVADTKDIDTAMKLATTSNMARLKWLI